MSAYILGISAFYHDSAACLVRDGRIVAAAQEERFTRKKFDPGFPARAIRYCLQAGEIGAFAVDEVIFQYSRAAKELWKFCNLGQVEFIARTVREEQPCDWWERGAPRRR